MAVSGTDYPIWCVDARDVGSTRSYQGRTSAKLIKRCGFLQSHCVNLYSIIFMLNLNANTPRNFVTTDLFSAYTMFAAPPTFYRVGSYCMMRSRDPSFGAGSAVNTAEA